MREKIVLDTGIFHVHFSGLNEKVKELMRGIYAGRYGAFTTPLNLTEVFYQYSWVVGKEGARVRLSLILDSSIRVIPPDKDLSMRAGEVKVDFSFLSIVDCFVVSLAERERARVITTDSAMHNVYRNTTFIGLSG